MVTSVIQHAVRPGAETEYEAWLKKIAPIAKRFPGHHGIEFIRPPGGSGTYTIMLRFDTLQHLQDWLRSGVRRELVEEAKQFFERGEKIDIKTGLEFWFTPPTPAQKHPAPYKQFLVTLSVVFPLTLVVPWVLRPLFQAMPAVGLPGVSNLLISFLTVGLMTYVIMPPYTRLLAKWLYG
jgi:antibiotic biosynthesis monooxygenase (ABM) superfamily enzyme